MYPSNRFLHNLSSLQGLQVLIVDDNVDFCDLMTAICQQSSYAIAQRILGHVPRHGDLSLQKQLEPSVSS